MSSSDIERLRDALAHCEHARAIGNHNEDPVRLKALLYNLIVIGTALGRLSPETKALDPDLPWRDVLDTRNRLVHAYWQIDLPFVASVVERDLPRLEAVLLHLIRALEDEGA